MNFDGSIKRMLGTNNIAFVIVTSQSVNNIARNYNISDSNYEKDMIGNLIDVRNQSNNISTNGLTIAQALKSRRKVVFASNRGMVLVPVNEYLKYY